MLFSSISFLYYFLPCVLIIYYMVPGKLKVFSHSFENSLREPNVLHFSLLKNGALLLVSLVFYAWGEPKYVFLMIALILFHYAAGLLLERYEMTKIRRIILWCTLTVSVGVLCFFKFSHAAWPIGISFYTFQLISYIVDVYRKTAPAQRNLINLGAYVTMFPQLIAGPIVRYADIEKQLRERTHSSQMTLEGIQRFLAGLGKKILISNALGELCEIFKASDEKSVLFFWIYAISYTLQIYFDFSGYSDMAIGLGEVFGFHFPENFNYPYVSKSITEFWRRWHMSLGTWFRDYVYIPMGGNRVSKPRWYFNIFVVWLLTGLWHGAAPNFIVWGLLFAVLLVIEKHWLLKKLEKMKLFNHLYVLFFVTISFVIFNAADMGEAMSYLAGMLGLSGAPLVSAEGVYYLRSYGMLLLVAMVGAAPFVKRMAVHFASGKAGRRIIPWVRPVFLLILLAVCTAYLIDSSFNPFLYFRF